jgi:hypothetical protein
VCQRADNRLDLRSGLLRCRPECLNVGIAVNVLAVITPALLTSSVTSALARDVVNAVGALPPRADRRKNFSVPGSRTAQR